MDIQTITLFGLPVILAIILVYLLLKTETLSDKLGSLGCLPRLIALVIVFALAYILFFFVSMFIVGTIFSAGNEHVGWIVGSLVIFSIPAVLITLILLKTGIMDRLAGDSGCLGRFIKLLILYAVLFCLTFFLICKIAG